MSTASRPALEVRGVEKSYPGVRALKGVDLTLRHGRVTALVGENGAGKSTVIRMIGGLETPDAGTIEVAGRSVTLTGSADAEAAGISVVSQEFRLVPQLTVAENVLLGHEMTRRGLIDRRASRKRTAEILADLGVDLDPGRRVDTLTVADQQLVEIARALSKDFDVLVMDEPTSALNAGEVGRLLDLVRRVRDRGAAVLYVSHRFDEIFAIADDVAVYRDGCSVAELAIERTDERQLVELMLGRELPSFEPSAAVEGEREPRLVVEGLVCQRVPAPIDLAVAVGEVVGIAGLIGSGRSELMRALFGVIPMRRGRVSIDGATVALRSPAEAIAAGVFMLGEDRKADGILGHLSVLENLLMSERRPARGGVRQWVPQPRAERRRYDEMRDRLRIKVDRPRQLIGNLSGGNQQKVLFGRAVLSGCSVLLLNEPTRGVDIGARVDIYDLVRELASTGVAVLVSSSDAAELATLVDRCLVLRGGAVVDELRGDTLSEHGVVAASLGQRMGMAS